MQLLNEQRSSLKIDLDHQRLQFQEESKTFAWKSGMLLQSDSEASTCDMYQLTIQEGCDSLDACTSCERPPINSWETERNTSFSVSDNDLSRDGSLVRFNIIQYDGNGQRCTNTNLEAMFQLNETSKLLL